MGARLVVPALLAAGVAGLGCGTEADTSTTCAELDGDYRAMAEVVAAPDSINAPDQSQAELQADAEAYVRALCGAARNEEYAPYSDAVDCMTDFYAASVPPCGNAKLPDR